MHANKSVNSMFAPTVIIVRIYSFYRTLMPSVVIRSGRMQRCAELNTHNRIRSTGAHTSTSSIVVLLFIFAFALIHSSRSVTHDFFFASPATRASFLLLLVQRT